MSFHVPEHYRLKDAPGGLRSTAADGCNGIFILPYKRGNHVVRMTVIASDQLGWEHVSVTLKHGLPTWPMMCFLKDAFWDKEDCVVQYHPPESDHVNTHSRCLHLWRPVDQELPKPASILVGLKGVNLA